MKESFKKFFRRIFTGKNYGHDCGECIFLGTYKNADLYFCEQGGFHSTVIARFSSDGPDYTSGLYENMSSDYLLEAKARAIKKNLIVESK